MGVVPRAVAPPVARRTGGALPPRARPSKRQEKENVERAGRISPSSSSDDDDERVVPSLKTDDDAEEGDVPEATATATATATDDGDDDDDDDDDDLAAALGFDPYAYVPPGEAPPGFE